MQLATRLHPESAPFAHMHPNALRQHVTDHVLPRLDLSRATARFACLEPGEFAMADTSDGAYQALMTHINEMLEEGLFVSHYVTMLDQGVWTPIVVDMSGDTPILLDGEVRSTIALARGEKVPAIVLEGDVKELTLPPLATEDFDDEIPW